MTQSTHLFVKYDNPIIINEEKNYQVTHEKGCSNEKKNAYSEKIVKGDEEGKIGKQSRENENSKETPNTNEDSNNNKKQTDENEDNNHVFSKTATSQSQPPPSSLQHIKAKNMLQLMFPPKSWRSPKDGKRYVQHVSKTSATSSDVLKLRHALNEKLSHLQKQQKEQKNQKDNHHTAEKNKKRRYMQCLF
mmetsp:Transcript_9698/g.14355  ORF Transcript_9698/g.14355 Transcript_9698/m.14355 type:complete len:190 (-) Transcript_9698:843-1412(-)